MVMLLDVVALSEGAWLKEAVGKSGLSADAYAKKVGVSRATLFAWFGRPVINADVEHLFNIMDIHGWATKQLKVEWEESKAFYSDPYQMEKERREWRIRLMNIIRWNVDTRWRDQQSNPEFDQNVVQASTKVIPYEIPTFDLSVAASGWIETADNETFGQYVSPQQIKQGLFRIFVRGDSMERKIPDGSLCEFRLLQVPTGEPDLRQLVKGEAYYFQLGDGRATLKFFEQFDGPTVTLSPANRKYKKLTANVADIVRVGKYEWTLTKG